MVLQITVASNTEGWDIVMNEQLIKALARDERVKVSGFVPWNTQEQRDQAKRMNISLYDAEEQCGFDSNELLSYPPDDLEIDILIMHSYGRDVGKQAQNIIKSKRCKWVLVVHIIRKDFETDLEMVASRAGEFQESEHELQVALCEKADLVLAVGHKVEKSYKAEMRTPIFTLIPSIPREFLDTQQHVRSSPFKVLLSASKKYFEVKGCAIAAKAFNQLEDPSIHLLLVVKEGDSASAIKESMVEKGISPEQLKVRRLFKGDQEEEWRRLLSEVDLLIKPSKSEGFGMAGLRAIAANLPVLISANCGLAMALEELPSGNKYVVNSQDPNVWARKIQEIKEKDEKICRSEAEQLKNEYSAAYILEDQVNSLIDAFSEMVKSDIQHGVKETL